MRFVCDSCKAKYSISDEKVRGKILKIRCKKCKNIIEVRDPAASTGTAGAEAVRPSWQAGASDLLTGFGGAPSSPPGAPQGEGALADDDDDEEAGLDQGPAEHTVISAPGLLEELRRTAADLAHQPTEEPALCDWYVAIDEEPTGPVTREQVRGFVSTGRASGESLVWREGYDDWRPLRESPELKDLVRGSQAYLSITAPPSRRKRQTGPIEPVPRPAPSPAAPPPAPSVAARPSEALRGQHVGKLGGYGQVAGPTPYAASPYAAPPAPSHAPPYQAGAPAFQPAAPTHAPAFQPPAFQPPAPTHAPLFQMPAPTHAPAYQTGAPAFQPPAPTHAPAFQTGAPAFQTGAPAYQTGAPAFQPPAPTHAPLFQPPATAPTPTPHAGSGSFAPPTYYQPPTPRRTGQFATVPTPPPAAFAPVQPAAREVAPQQTGWRPAPQHGPEVNLPPPPVEAVAPIFRQTPVAQAAPVAAPPWPPPAPAPLAPMGEPAAAPRDTGSAEQLFLAPTPSPTFRADAKKPPASKSLSTSSRAAVSLTPLHEIPKPRRHAGLILAGLGAIVLGVAGAMIAITINRDSSMGSASASNDGQPSKASVRIGTGPLVLPMGNTPVDDGLPQASADAGPASADVGEGERVGSGGRRRTPSNPGASNGEKQLTDDERRALEQAKALGAEKTISLDRKSAGGGSETTKRGEPLTDEQIRNTVNKNSASIRACYEREMRGTSADLRVDLRISVSPSGVVSSARVRTPQVQGSRLADCMERTARRWMFPPATASSVVDVPFFLTSAGSRR